MQGTSFLRSNTKEVNAGQVKMADVHHEGSVLRASIVLRKELDKG